VQRTYELAGRLHRRIQRGRVCERVGVVDDDSAQSRACSVISCDPVEVRLAHRYCRRATAYIGGVQHGDGRFLDWKPRGAHGHGSPPCRNGGWNVPSQINSKRPAKG